MVYQTGYGAFRNRIFPAEKVHGEAEPVTIVCSSMQCFGFCVRALPGVIYLRTAVAGRTRTAVFAAGVTKESGNLSWNN